MDFWVHHRDQNGQGLDIFIFLNNYYYNWIIIQYSFKSSLPMSTKMRIQEKPYPQKRKPEIAISRCLEVPNKKKKLNVACPFGAHFQSLHCRAMLLLDAWHLPILTLLLESDYRLSVQFNIDTRSLWCMLFKYDYIFIQALAGSIRKKKTCSSCKALLQLGWTNTKHIEIICTNQQCRMFKLSRTKWWRW